MNIGFYRYARSIIVAFVFSALSIACGTNGQIHNPSGSVSERNTPLAVHEQNLKDRMDHWKLVDAGDFFLFVPESMQKRNVEGIDVLVLQYENLEIELRIQYGLLASTTLTQNQVRDRHERSDVFAGRERKISKSLLINKNQSASFKGFYMSAEFPGNDTSPDSLVFEASYLNSADNVTVMKIFNSVQFKKE